MSNSSLKNRHSVRKTLTIDSDLADAIEHLVKVGKGKTKEKFIVNDLLRKGLAAQQRVKSQPTRQLPAFPCGLRDGVSKEDVERLLDEI